MQNQQDEALLAAFHLMDAEERSFWLMSTQAAVEGRQRIKPKLALVPRGNLSGCDLFRGSFGRT